MPAKRRRIIKALARTAVLMLLAWLALSAFVAWKLTRRAAPMKHEVAPVFAFAKVEEYRIKTSDRQDLGAWLIRGSNPVSVLLLHGNGASRTAELPLMEDLGRDGYSVLAITFRAHGDSSGTVNDVGYSARNDVTAAVSFLEREVPGKKIVIVGHSLGAAAALFSARDCAGHVSGYVLESPYLDLSTAVWNRCDNQLCHPFSDSAYWGLRLWAAVFLPESPKLIRPVDHVAEIPAGVPVTIIASKDDRHARLWEAEEFARRAGGRAKLVAMGGKHGHIFAENREEYLAAIRRLLQRVEPGTIPLPLDAHHQHDQVNHK